MNSLGTFQVGQRPVITATFTDVLNGGGIATGATFIVKDPTGTETPTTSPNASITNPTPNVWVFVMPTITASGTYFIRCKATAGLVAASDSTITVTVTPIANP